MKRLAATALLVLAAQTAPAAGPFGGTVHAIAFAEGRGTPGWAATDRGLFRHETDRWVRVEGLAHRDLRAVVEVPGRLVVLEAHRGLLRGDPEGETWERVETGLTGPHGRRADDLVFLSAGRGYPSPLYVGAAGVGLFESRDDGGTWSLLDAGLEAEPPQALHPRAALPARGGRPLLMGTAGRGLFARRQGRWEPAGAGLPAGLRVEALAEDPGDPLHLALATRGAGAWASSDGGASWARLREGQYGISGAVSIGRDGAVLAHFPEEGLLFARGDRVELRPALAAARVNTLVALPGGGWLAGLDHDGVLELSALGEPAARWVEGLDATRVGALHPGPADGTLWAGDANGVFFSADAGRTWEARDDGLLGASADVFLWHRGRLYVGSGGQGVFRLLPETRTWEQRSVGLGTANTIFSLVEDAGGDRLYAGTEGGVLRSDDGGGRWVRTNKGLPGGSMWFVAASRAHPGRLWAAGGGGVYRSDDAGDSWTRVRDARAVALATQRLDREETVWVLEPGRVFAVTDGPESGGAPVPPVERGERLNCLVAGVDDTLWVGGSRGVWVLGPGGARRAWEGAPVSALLVGPGDRGWVGTDGAGVTAFETW